VPQGGGKPPLHFVSHIQLEIFGLRFLVSWAKRVLSWDIRRGLAKRAGAAYFLLLQSLTGQSIVDAHT
jgi:hypothetical protein